MKSNKTELVFILDRSGSMSGLESDTIGGFNSMLKKQKKLADSATVTTVLFDDRYELLHDRIKLSGIEPITEKEYFVRGSTALLDAVGKTINKIKNVQKITSKGEKASKVLFVIITDGLENASREYNHKKIKSMISDMQDKHNWEFIFLGANIDAIEAAGHMGIQPRNAVDYHADPKGTQVCYSAVAEAVGDILQDKKLSAKWKKSVQHDYQNRKQ